MTKEQQGKLREYHTAMMTVSEIAEKMQLAPAEIRRGLVDMGYLPIEKKPKAESEFTKGFKPVMIPERKYVKVTPEIESAVIRLRKSKMSITQISETLGVSRSNVHRIINRNKEDKPVKINKEFDAAVDEMIADSIEKKEPAPDTDADPTEKKDISNNYHNNDNTIPEESQAPADELTGISALGVLEGALAEALGSDAQITRIFAERQIAELFFCYGGKEYGFTFGVKEGIPDYEITKH